MIKVRKAVGAIIKKNEKYLLVRKIKITNSKKGPERINPIWSFPIGGVKANENLKLAVMREIREETGLTNIKVLKRFKEPFSFNFSTDIAKKLGYDCQVTTMFLVEYYGDSSETKSQNEEIDRIEFLNKDEVLVKLSFENSKKYFSDHLAEID